VVPGAAVSRANPAGKSTGASVIPGSQRRSGNSRSVLFVIGGANRPAASRRRSTPSAEGHPRAASTSAESDRLFGIGRAIAATEGGQQISAFDVDTPIAARSQPQSTRMRRVVSHHQRDQMDIPRPIEERAEGFRTASTASGPRASHPSGPAAPRLSLHPMGHRRGTRAPGRTRDTRCRLHNRTHPSAACSTWPRDRWRGVRNTRADRLALRATWRWRRNHVLNAPGDAALSDFHLGHRGGAVFTGEARCTTRHQLLRAERRDNCELVGIQMAWTGNHESSRFVDCRRSACGDQPWGIAQR